MPMETKNTPPPQLYVHEDLPSYYYGKLLYYDEDGKDNCRWVVYDGHSKVRCPTRSSALDYIISTKAEQPTIVQRRLLQARMDINNAYEALRKAADSSAGAEQLLLDRLSVKLRPLLVELDNLLIKP